MIAVAKASIDRETSGRAVRSEKARDDIYVKYWKLIREMAESGLFDIAAHLDLPKKLCFYPSSYLSVHIVAALDAMNETVLAQKFERAVDRDRRRTIFLL